MVERTAWDGSLSVAGQPVAFASTNGNLINIKEPSPGACVDYRASLKDLARLYRDS